MDIFGSGEHRWFERTLNFVFLTSSILFVCIYLPLTLQICDQTVNRVDGFVEGSTCFCSINLGASQELGSKIIKASNWGQQFVNLNPYVTSLSLGNGVAVVVDAISIWSQFYYAIEWTDQLTKANIDMFNFTDYLNISPSPRLPYSCRIVFNGTSQIFNTSSECLISLRSHIPNFQNIMSISYLENDVVQEACQSIQYCEVSFCPRNGIINAILFCVAIVSAIYSFLKIIHHFGIFCIKKSNHEEKQKIFPNV